MEACLTGLAEQAAGGGPMHAMAVFPDLRKLLGRQDSIAFDGGDFCHFGCAYLPARRPPGLSYFSTFGMLGTGLPTGLAMKLARPETNVVAATGDGGFGFNGFELDTAIRHGINVVVVLGNDAAWRIDRQIQLGVLRAAGGDRSAVDPLRRGGADWAPSASTCTGGPNFGRRYRPPSRRADPRWCTWRSPAPEAHARRRRCSAGARLRNTARTAPGSREEQPRAPTARPPAVCIGSRRVAKATASRLGGIAVHASHASRRGRS